MKKDTKVSFKNKILFWMGENIIPILIKLNDITLRKKYIGQEKFKKYYKKQKAIYAFWHGNIMLILSEHCNSNVKVLISEHADGEIIARTVSGLGYGLVRGSSTRGGSKAVKGIIKILKNNGEVAITPDGPKGPYRVLKKGLITLAQLSGAPIITFSSYSKNPIILKSWDNFMIIKPFSKCMIIYSEPIYIDRNLNEEQIEEKRKFVEEKMHELDKMAKDYIISG